MRARVGVVMLGSLGCGCAPRMGRQASAIRAEGAMDDATFDRMTRTFDRLASRRLTLGRLGAFGLAGGARAVLGLTSSQEADARKKKKCKKPKVKCGKKCCAAGQVCASGKCAPGCKFTKTPTLWTLQADCTTTSIIDIPDGVTLEGNNKTVSMAGKANALLTAIRARGGGAGLKNITVDGSGLTGPCGAPTAAILFSNTTGEVFRATVQHISCGHAIAAVVGQDAEATQTVNVQDVTVIDVNHQDGNEVAAVIYNGVSTEHGLSGTTIVSFFQNVTIGVLLVGNVEIIVETNDMVEVSNAGIIASAGAIGTATGNTVTGATFGMGVAEFSPLLGPSTLTATGNTIVGPGPVPGPAFGVAFFDGTEGSVDGNTISNYFDSAGTDGCGIFVADNAGDVTVGANTFPDPGNEQNVCDLRP